MRKGYMKMKYEIDNQKIQDKEVRGWWNDDRTKKWHNFTYDKDKFMQKSHIHRKPSIY